MYTNNLHSGTATVTITGKGNYSGSIVRTFAITARPLTLTSQTPASRAYDGTAVSFHRESKKSLKPASALGF